MGPLTTRPERSTLLLLCAPSPARCTVDEKGTFGGGTHVHATRTHNCEWGVVKTNHIISDSFEGTSISPKVWGFYGTNQPNNITLTQKDDALYVSVSSAATNDFTAGLTTRCKLRGDFDAVLSFKLVTWPPKNGVWLNLGTDSPFNVYRVTWLYQTGDDYGAYLPPAGAIAPASGNSGVLRLSRLAGKRRMADPPKRSRAQRAIIVEKQISQLCAVCSPPRSQISEMAMFVRRDKPAWSRG